MELKQPRRTAFLTMALSIVLAGCATSPRDQEADVYGLLYDGESTAAYATAFPVSTPAEAYRNAERAAQEGDLDRALYEYIRGLELEEEPVADPLYRVGAIHHRQGNEELAEMAYRMALDADHAHGAAGTGLGLLQLERRRHREAEAQLYAVADNGNGSWRTYNALGILADLQEDFDTAARHYNRALEWGSRNPVVLNNLGYSRYLAADWEGARSALQQAVRNAPDYDLAWRNIGLVHAREGNYEDAIEAVRRSGSEAEAYNDIGYVAMMEGRYSEAMTFFREAMRLSPTFYTTASENAEEAERRHLRNETGRME